MNTKTDDREKLVAFCVAEHINLSRVKVRDLYSDEFRPLVDQRDDQPFVYSAAMTLTHLAWRELQAVPKELRCAVLDRAMASLNALTAEAPAAKFRVVDQETPQA